MLTPIMLPDNGERLQTLISSIPDPASVRSALSNNIREARILRRILKISQDAEKTRQQTDGAVSHAS